MPLDKVKTLRAAEKYLEMGKIPAAIKEYCKIVEDEPSDFTTLNTLGDLHVRVGNAAAAITCFRRIAEHYRSQDFTLKAIAMFKKIDRLHPNDIEIATSLAELYAQQELVVEARAHYLVVANAHAKSGATQAGLEILSKIADLDPQNTQIRLKLAEGYLSEGLMSEAAAAFTEAGNNLYSRGALDEALAAFSKSLEIEPNDIPTLNGLLGAHTARGTADEAAEIIARASSAKPENLELRSLLINAYIQAEDPQQAESATAALVEAESSAYLRFVDVARLYMSLDNIDAGVSVLARVSEQMLSEREDKQLLDLVNEFLTRDTDDVQALRLLVRVYWWQRDAENLRAALDRLAEASETAGLVDDERYALTQLTRLAPEHAAYANRLKELGGAAEDAVAETLPQFESAADADNAAPTVFGEFEIQNEETVSQDVGAFEWNSADDATITESQSDAGLDLERGFTFDTVVAEELAAQPEPLSGDDEERKSALRTQELESVDFYIAQGYADIAIDTLNLLESQFGSHPDIESRRKQLVQGNGSSELFIEADASLEPEIAESAAEFSFIPDNVEYHPTVNEPAAPVLAPAIDAGLAEVFEEYRVSAEAEVNGNGDFETHYNLGLAYQEMDLFEEALEEFQIAIGLISADDGTPRYLQCCNLMGHCFMKKGVPQLAVKWFNKGLSAPNTSDDERQALRFDLAAAYEQAGDLAQAKNLFTEIYGNNVSYRGVNERLKQLESRMM